MTAPTVVIDRRTRPVWVERRADRLDALAGDGIASGQIARTRNGRRDTDQGLGSVVFTGGSEGLARRRPGRRPRIRRAA